MLKEEISLAKFFDEVGAEVSKETVEDEVLEAREEVINEDVLGLGGPRPVVPSRTDRMRQNRVLVNNLREHDDAHNRTCALCMKRKPIDDFLRLKTSEMCKSCEI